MGLDMGHDPEIAVVVLNHNGAEFLMDCFGSVASSSFSSFDMVLVDNASQDHSMELVRSEFPSVVITRNETNLGFAEGYDRAVRSLPHDRLVLLNNDTIVDRHWLRSLVEAADSDQRVAACTSRVLLMEDPTILDHAGGVFSLIGSGIEPGKWDRDPGPGGAPVQVGFGSGCSLLVRRQAYLDVGGFDPWYGFYHEDVDLCWKFRMFGYSVVYVPDSIVLHHVGGGGYQGIDENPMRTYFCQKNRLANMIKNLGVPNLLKGMVASSVYDILRIARFASRKRRDLLAAVFRGYKDALSRLPELLRQRRFVQRRRTCSDRDLRPYLPSVAASVRQYRLMLKAHRHRQVHGKWSAACSVSQPVEAELNPLSSDGGPV